MSLKLFGLAAVRAPLEWLGHTQAYVGVDEIPEWLYVFLTVEMSPLWEAVLLDVMLGRLPCPPDYDQEEET